MPAICFILVHLLLHPLWAAPAASIDIPVAEGDRLVLVGLEAQVHIVGQAGASLKVSGAEGSGDEGAYVVVKKKNIIEVKMNEYVGKRTWLNILPRTTQVRKIEISGASIPAEISLRHGSVVAQKWNKDLKVSVTQGRVSSLNGAGSLQVYVQKGDVNIQDHVGKVEVDSYNSTVALKNVQGDLEADLFAGQVQLEKIRGFLALTTQQANIKVNQGSGSIQFENGKGSLNIQVFQGRVEGKNQEGSVNITMPLDSETDVKTKSGKVSVQLPPGSGAHLNLLTTEGEIYVPSELKVNKTSTEKSVRGRLRGDAQKGSVFVRSQDGVISVK